MQYRKAGRTFHLTPSDNPLADISPTGARLVVEREFKVGSMATVEISSATQKISLKTKIVRSAKLSNGKFDTGVHYLDVSSEQAKTLQLLLDGHDRGVPLKAALS